MDAADEAMLRAVKAQMEWEVAGRPAMSGHWPNASCPRCGYPERDGHKGLYHPGVVCDSCGYQEPVC